MNHIIARSKAKNAKVNDKKLKNSNETNDDNKKLFELGKFSFASRKYLEKILNDDNAVDNGEDFNQQKKVKSNKFNKNQKNYEGVTKGRVVTHDDGSSSSNASPRFLDIERLRELPKLL